MIFGTFSLGFIYLERLVEEFNGGLHKGLKGGGGGGGATNPQKIVVSAIYTQMLGNLVV